MLGQIHGHVCPRCQVTWNHNEAGCTCDIERICDRCRLQEYWRITDKGGVWEGPQPNITFNEWRLMHHLEMHTRQELDQLLAAGDPGFLSTWIKEEDERAATDEFWEVDQELVDFQDALEWAEELNEEELNSDMQQMRKELSGLNPDSWRAYLLERRLEICQRELSRRRTWQMEEEAKKQTAEKPRLPAVEFMAQVGEFLKAVKSLRPARSKGRKARADFVDINARTVEIELVAPSVSSVFPAEVTRSGYARAPYLVFEWFSKAVKTLREPCVHVSILGGQVKAANLTFSHPDISIRPIGARIADLPIDAPLPDVLALLVKFRPEELSDSGLLARVLAAQESASALIDRAIKTLAPLEIKREELSQFIWEQVKKRTQRDQ